MPYHPHHHSSPSPNPNPNPNPIPIPTSSSLLRQEHRHRKLCVHGHGGGRHRRPPPPQQQQQRRAVQQHLKSQLAPPHPGGPSAHNSLRGGGRLVSSASAASSASSPHLPVLDRDAFASVVVVPCIRVPAQQTSKFVGVLQANGCLLERRAKVVVKEAQSETRLILLREDAFRPGDALPKKVVEELKLDGVPPPQVASHNLSLGYDDKSAHEILQAILPPAMEVPTSFETIGHIAHLNLPEAPPELDAQPEGTWAAHKRIIGQVILDKNPCIRTVVNKVGVITNEFRVFDMEVLAGEHNLVTEISQHGVRYRLDYSKTYWNSRLETEHRRLVDRYFREGEMILDLMCGVGPFALPAAKKGCKVIANDLNKHSVHWLLVNARLNNIDADSVVALNMDAREVVRFLSESPDLKEAPSFGLGGAEGSAIPEPPQATPGFSVPQGGKTFDHVVMNLPRNALEFLDIFKGSFAGKSWADRALPQIHVYTFMNTSATDEEVREQIEARVGGKLDVMKPTPIRLSC